jgi:hypothetical protein
MDWDVRYIGIYTYFENKNTIDVIEWDDNNLMVYHDCDNMAADGWEDYDMKIYYQYFDVSNEVFDILASVIENNLFKIEYFASQ